MAGLAGIKYSESRRDERICRPCGTLFLPDTLPSLERLGYCQLHPDNRHVRDKIRQQLQVLRDAKLLIHVGSGLWRLP
jgi:Dam-replacing HTH domain